MINISICIPSLCCFECLWGCLIFVETITEKSKCLTYSHRILLRSSAVLPKIAQMSNLFFFSPTVKIRKFRIMVYIFIYEDCSFKGPRCLQITNVKALLLDLFVAFTSVSLFPAPLKTTSESFQLLSRLAPLLLVFSLNVTSSQSLPSPSHLK